MSVALGLAACAEGSAPQAGGPRGTSSPQPTPSPAGVPLEPEGLEAPPPVVVSGGDRALELHAWTYCYGNGCADGSPPADPPDVGSPDEVFVEFPLRDWTFSASFVPAGAECGREQRVDLKESDGGFVLEPAGHAGAYDVTLFGKGDGDLFVTFRWTTTRDGRLPEPRARLAVLADHDGEVDSYGVELEVRNLARTPRDPRATITVRAADGDSLTFEAERARGSCWPEGTVYWDGPDAKGLEAARLGEPPFTYEVELMIDGETYRAKAVWPADEIPTYGPSVRLFFDPPLPGLS
ncbi:MAG: hypothetical protein M3134_00450 [Actinomycetota bacterium]|nr:hypothetical protein [Actinomycetota bacterium]